MSQSTPGHGDLMNYLVRMVVPMRREFGRQLDVQHFLHDMEYAREVVQQALASQDARLLQYAKYVDAHHFGPGNTSSAAAATPAEQAAAPATAATPHIPTEVAPKANPTAAEMREQVLRKYTSGLR